MSAAEGPTEKQVRRRGRWSLVVGTLIATLMVVAVGYADVIAPDADFVTAGNQTSRNLGNVAPGATLMPQVNFELQCAGAQHVDNGKSVTLNFDSGSSTIPAGGSLSATNTSIGPIPASWPDDTNICGSPSPVAIQDNGNSTVTITAPVAPGTYTFIPSWSLVEDEPSDVTGANPSVSFTLTVEAPANDAPSVAADNATITVDEGDLAANTGTWSDSNAGDTVTLSASIGTIVKSGTNAGGTWSWSYQTTDGPDDSQMVTITADDGTGGMSSTTFQLNVNNVAPEVTLSPGNDLSVDESATAEVTYNYTIDDPGDDTVDAVSTGCGANGDKVAGSDSFNDTSGSFKCIFPDGGSTPPGTDTAVSASATDSDGNTGAADTQTVNIKNVAPTISGFTITVPSGPACQGATNNVSVAFTVSDPADNAHDPITGTITWGDGNTTNISGRTISENYNYSAGVWSLTVSVNDGDGGSDNAGGTNNVSLLYANSGILPPINLTGPRSSFKIGSTIPVKIRVTDCNGASVSGLTLHVKLQKLDSSASPVNETVEVSVPDAGDVMRYDSSALPPQYIYNLSTKRSQLCSSSAPCTSGGDLTPGTYKVTVYNSVIAPASADIDTR